ncbi:hypothetical protein BDY24DRAFT_433964 [Mrakia frigida]|uniref:uncharacterized protein n=1 Tax=Mrakia frigida TaxID=29902 RepID=UPI003FCBEF7A
MSIVPPRVRTLLHLLFALFALSLVRFITTRTPSESSEAEDLRRKALVLAITTLAGLVVVRAEDLFEHDGPVDEAFKEKMDLMERSLGFAGAVFWGDSPAITFIAPSVVSLLLMSFSSHQHRTPLIFITSLILIFHTLATASYTLSYVRDIAPVCNALVNSVLGIIPSNPPIECELSRTLHFVSTLTLASLVVRLAVLHSTPMKSERNLSFLEFLGSE